MPFMSIRHHLTTGLAMLVFFTCYTPHGIHAIDNEFIRRIVHFRGTRKQRQALRNEIIHNPHLHGVIKRNLLENLDSR